jgi:hypothetical protein
MPIKAIILFNPFFPFCNIFPPSIPTTIAKGGKIGSMYQANLVFVKEKSNNGVKIQINILIIISLWVMVDLFITL